MTKAQTGVVLPVIRRIKEKTELPIDSSTEERNFIAEMASKKPRKPRKPAVKAEIPVAPVEERNFIVGIGASAGGWRRCPI